MPTEADTCRTYVLPALYRAGWTDEQIREQVTFTPGRIIVAGGKVHRGKRKRLDYMLSFQPDLPLALVEAKAELKLPGDGLQQAKQYAETLDLKFAYSTNGVGIVEFDYTTGLETELSSFPTPEELWQRHCRARGIDPNSAQLLAPYFREPGQAPRYYQDISIHRATEAILKGNHRVLLTLATGTGKTVVAFQLCWRLWSTGWNRLGEHRKPRMLYLADRNVLVDDPKDKTFAPFGDARLKIGSARRVQFPSRDQLSATASGALTRSWSRHRMSKAVTADATSPAASATATPVVPLGPNATTRGALIASTVPMEMR